MESANGILKTEGMYTKFGRSAFKNHKFSSEEVLKQDLFYNFYNTKRPKKSLGDLSPVEFRLQSPKRKKIMVLDKKRYNKVNKKCVFLYAVKNYVVNFEVERKICNKNKTSA